MYANTLFFLPAGLKSRFYGLDDEQCSVEELALQYYASEEGGGWQGVHRQAPLAAEHACVLATAWQLVFRGLLPKRILDSDVRAARAASGRPSLGC